ncbi:hypothetical protein OG21DRAFT_1491393 [Imleria badia]|nr:hypothetical protein OG21DRAFT_1491393 [Imleria badia]
MTQKSKRMDRARRGEIGTLDRSVMFVKATPPCSKSGRHITSCNMGLGDIKHPVEPSFNDHAEACTDAVMEVTTEHVEDTRALPSPQHETMSQDYVEDVDMAALKQEEEVLWEEPWHSVPPNDNEALGSAIPGRSAWILSYLIAHDLFISLIQI